MEKDLEMEKVYIATYQNIASAILNQNIELAKIIIQSNVNILCDLRNIIGETLIHLAVNLRCIDLIHCLMQNHYDINALDFTKKTALHLAVSLKFDDIVEGLLYYNAKMDIKDNYGYSPFHLAVIGGNISLIKVFLDHGADIMDYTSNNLETCFHLAILDGNYEVFDILLQNYQGSLDVINAFGDSVLHELARRKNTNLVKMLYDRGENIEVVNKDGNTALHIAAQQRNYKLVELLLKCGADINASSRYDECPLHIAIRNRDAETVSLLLLYGANAEANSYNKNSPLHLAVRYYNVPILQRLLMLDINIDSRNGDTITPFHLAVEQQNRTASILLLNRGANINSVSSKVWMKYQEFKGPNYTQHKYLRPLHTAIIHKDFDGVKFLLKNGAKLDVEDQFETFLAIDVGCSKILELLLNYGANINFENNGGESLIYRALTHYNIDLVETILKNGAKVQDVLTAAKLNDPILHSAARRRESNFVHYLLRLGIDINHLDSEQHTALWYAREWNQSVAEVLIKHIALIKIKNGVINELNEYILNTYPDCLSCYTRCLDELDNLKEANCCGVSLVLFLTKNETSLPKLLRNRDVYYEFSKTASSKKYPVYMLLLQEKIINAVQRWSLVKQAKDILHSFSCLDSLYDVADNILDNFSKKELSQFIQISRC